VEEMVMKTIGIILLLISPVVWGYQNSIFSEIISENKKICTQSTFTNECDTKFFSHITDYSYSENQAYVEFGIQHKKMEIGFNLPEENWSIGINLNNRFNFGLQFDKKTYYVGDQAVVAHRPKIDASYKGYVDWSWISGGYKIVGRWKNPKDLFFEHNRVVLPTPVMPDGRTDVWEYNQDLLNSHLDNLYPAIPLMETRSEIESRVFYLGIEFNFEFK
jgi:hypothetical protein